MKYYCAGCGCKRVVKRFISNGIEYPYNYKKCPKCKSGTLTTTPKSIKPIKFAKRVNRQWRRLCNFARSKKTCLT